MIRTVPPFALALVVGLAGAAVLSPTACSPAHAAEVSRSITFAPAVVVGADAVAPVAPAAPAIPTSIDSADSLVAFGRLLLDAERHHDTQLLVGLILVLLVLVSRKAAAFAEAQSSGPLATLGAKLRSPLGGRILVFAWSALGAIAAVELAHEHWSATVAWGVVSTGVIASGGWSLLIEPLVKLIGFAPVAPPSAVAPAAKS